MAQDRNPLARIPVARKTPEGVRFAAAVSMFHLSPLVAHGGLVGAIAESLVVIAVSAVLVAVWIRERRAGRASEGPARLRDEDEK